MREFLGKPIGIFKPVMGVVATKTYAHASGKQLIRIVRSSMPVERLFSRFLPYHYEVCVVPDCLNLAITEDIPSVLNVPEAECLRLNDGDIISIEPTGRVTVLYEARSPHNAIFITNRCNCSCIMCPQPPTLDPPGLLEQNYSLISLISGKRKGNLGITGGEPTILGEDLNKLIKTCREKLPDTTLTLLTNGRKLKDLEFARSLILAGYPWLLIEIPLYGDNDTEHDSIMGANGSFYETLQGLHNLALLGQPVGLRTVVHRMTINRLVQYAEFVYRNLPFVVQVAFMGMETTGLARKNLDLLWLDPYNYGNQLSLAVKYLNRRKVPVSSYNHQLCTLPKDLRSFARRSISTWEEIYLPFCNECSVKEFCCGIFGTGEKYSDFLRPLGRDEGPVP
jgi:His-Xaa-Ser system radical SAM maturase HxsC